MSFSHSAQGTREPLRAFVRTHVPDSAMTRAFDMLAAMFPEDDVIGVTVNGHLGVGSHEFVSVTVSRQPKPEPKPEPILADGAPEPVPQPDEPAHDVVLVPEVGPVDEPSQG